MTVKKAIITSFIIGIALGVACLAGFILLYSHQYKQRQLRLSSINCEMNLRQLGVVLRQYAAANNGRFPDEWDAIEPALRPLRAVDATSMFRCPIQFPVRWAELAHLPHPSVDKSFFESVSYELVPGRRVNDAQGTVLAREHEVNHDHGHAELYVDGSVAWVWSKQP